MSATEGSTARTGTPASNQIAPRRRLPKPEKNTRCSALDSDGRQCPYEATYTENYHGEDELYGYFSHSSMKERVWVRVYFCNKHVSIELA